jgi:hypothetical protein
MSKRRLKRFLYISQSKVDSASAQLDGPLYQRIVGTLRLNLPPFGLDLSPRASRDTLIKRLRVVLEHLEQSGSIGTVEAPMSYFRGSIAMVEAEIGDPEPILLYAGRQAETLIGMTGSVSNAIGRRELEATGSRRASLDNAFEREARPPALKRATMKSRRASAMGTAARVAWVVETRAHLAQPVEFVAETLSVSRLTDDEGQEGLFLLGTPLFVALAD